MISPVVNPIKSASVAWEENKCGKRRGGEKVRENKIRDSPNYWQTSTQ
tara:strand:+ start:234 stop:377 length:144 start_codon:yes stop_codon:yes gene_type:complete